ncbi:flagellar basal-body rod protein FlgG [Undibacterium flavidum]|uniref:Flagellar basal-body rod protein FlgG n=1 Tax=Undibacterium flavidum TaxID=2762297 RepID=A0ABR6YEU8_9BURK|nr:flagellar basal-body rod protein FlgG [Undibacterium flavidum]MBC3875068.1 flagellar basal-body rod protein FlgG [Undibacterium flavidum]
MSKSLYIGATGMQAQQANVDAIANNLANANTPGYKKSRVSFTDMMVQDVARTNPLGGAENEVGLAANLARIGAGVRIAATGKMFDQGELKRTDSALDIAIQGDGFIEINMPDGSVAYSRGGTLKLTKEGQLALASGPTLKASMVIPDSAQSMTIAGDGTVRYRLAGQSTDVEAGKIELVNFVSPGQLSVVGDNLYKANEASGEALNSSFGDVGVGTISQGYVEASNVKMVEEMVNLMIAQRTYEANVKLVQAADEMQGMINNLRK